MNNINLQICQFRSYRKRFGAHSKNDIKQQQRSSNASLEQRYKTDRVCCNPRLIQNYLNPVRCQIDSYFSKSSTPWLTLKAFYCFYEANELAHITDLLTFRTCRANWTSLPLRQKKRLVRLMLSLYCKAKAFIWEQPKSVQVLVGNRLNLTCSQEQWEWTWLLRRPSHSKCRQAHCF